MVVVLLVACQLFPFVKFTFVILLLRYLNLFAMLNSMITSNSDHCGNQYDLRLAILEINK